MNRANLSFLLSILAGDEANFVFVATTGPRRGYWFDGQVCTEANPVPRDKAVAATLHFGNDLMYAEYPGDPEFHPDWAPYLTRAPGVPADGLYMFRARAQADGYKDGTLAVTPSSLTPPEGDSSNPFAPPRGS